VINYRRKLGWIIVFVSFIVGVYKLASHFQPAIEINESTLNWVGVSFFALMMLFYSYTLFNSYQTPK